MMKRGFHACFIVSTIIALISVSFPSCGGGGSDSGDNAPPPGGTGADNVPIFWMHYGSGFGGGLSVQQTAASLPQVI